jgi:hypothetical protein
MILSGLWVCFRGGDLKPPTSAVGHERRSTPVSATHLPHPTAASQETLGEPPRNTSSFGSLSCSFDERAHQPPPDTTSLISR